MCSTFIKRAWISSQVALPWTLVPASLSSIDSFSEITLSPWILCTLTGLSRSCRSMWNLTGDIVRLAKGHSDSPMSSALRGQCLVRDPSFLWHSWTQQPKLALFIVIRVEKMVHSVLLRSWLLLGKNQVMTSVYSVLAFWWCQPHVLHHELSCSVIHEYIKTFALTHFSSRLQYSHRVTNAGLCFSMVSLTVSSPYLKTPMAVPLKIPCYCFQRLLPPGLEITLQVPHQSLILPGTDHVFHIPLCFTHALSFMSEMFFSTLSDDIILLILQSSDQMSPQL